MYHFILLLIVLSVGTAAVNAQEACTANAQWDDETSKCKCTTGFGDPDFCCYDPDVHDACIVAGDPYMITFDNATVNMNFPCATLISSTSTVDNGKRCKMDVYTSNNQMSDASIFYVSKFQVDVTYDGKKISFYLDLTKRIPEVLIKEVNKADRIKRLSNALPVFFTQRTVTEVIATSQPNLDSVMFYGCSTSLTMRGAKTTTRDQKKSPGVCVMMDKTVQRDNLSARCFIQKTSKREVFAPMFMRMSEEAINPLESGSMSSQCRLFTTFSLKCKPNFLQFTYEHCAFLLLNADVRMCLWELVANNRKSSVVMTSFNLCVRTLCDTSQSEQTTTCFTSNFLRDNIIKKCAPSVKQSCITVARNSKK